MDMRVDDIFEISISVFLKLKGALPFSVYIHLNDINFVQILKAEDVLDRTRLDAYIKKGVKSLCVPKTDRQAYIETVEKLVASITNRKDVSSDDAALIMEELTE